MLSLDPLTKQAYDAGTSTTAKVTAVRDALVEPVAITVYDENAAVVGTGIFSSPWATVSNNTLVLGQLATFTTSQNATIATGWTVRITSGSRWITGSFGTVGSGADFIWTLNTWTTDQNVKIGTARASTWMGSAANDASDWFSIDNSVIVGWLFDQADGEVYNLNVTALPGNEVTLPQSLFHLPEGMKASWAVVDPTDGTTITQETLAWEPVIITVGQNVTPTENYDVTVSLQTATTAEADWLARSTGEGVIFAHDFRTYSEVTAFLRNRSSSDAARGHDPVLVPAVAGSSGALKLSIIGTTLAQPVALTTKGAEEVWTITNGSDFPVAVYANAATHYPVLVGTKEIVLMVSGPTFTGGVWQCTVKRETDNGWTGNDGTISAHAAGTRLSVRSSDWERPLIPLPAGALGNGKATADPKYGSYGIGNWNKAGSAPQSDFRGGYWAHASTAAAQMPGGVWNSDMGAIPNAYMGDEFYIQYRVRISASKWGSFGAGTLPAKPDMTLPSGKHFYLQTASGSSAQQIYVPVGGDTYTHVLVLDGQNPGSHAEVNPWDGRDLSSGSLTGKQIQPGGEYGATCLYPSSSNAPGACWRWPADTWVTVLLRVKPSGINYYNRTAQLAAPLSSVDYYLGDGVTRNYPTTDIACVPGSLATWPDPAEYEYYIQIQSAGSAVTPATSGTQYEAMRVTAINYATDTLTVVRNIYRTDRNTNRTHPATSSFLYGMSSGAKSYGWMNDPRLCPNKNGLVEVKVAIEGETSYKTVFSMNNIPMMYGDASSAYGNFTENPAGFNSFMPTHFPNHYVSGEGAWDRTSSMEFTQIILSKNPIPCPEVWS